MLPFVHKPAVLDLWCERVLVDTQNSALELDFILFPTISSHLIYSDNQSSYPNKRTLGPLELESCRLVDVDSHLKQRDSKRHAQN